MLGIYQRIEAYMTCNLLSYCNDKVFQENHLFKYWLKKVSWIQTLYLTTNYISLLQYYKMINVYF